MEQENQEQDGEMKQEFQSYRDEIKNKVGLSNVCCTPRYLGLNVLPRIEPGPPKLERQNEMQNLIFTNFKINGE